MVRRYNWCGEVTPDDDGGNYVLYEDYEKLEKLLIDTHNAVVTAFNGGWTYGRELMEKIADKTVNLCDFEESVVRDNAILRNRLGECHDKLRDLHQELFPEERIR